MIEKLTKTFVQQKCDCGAVNKIHYDRIKYDPRKKLAQLIFPACEQCKKRIEFIFVSSGMKEIELKLYLEMNERGLLK